VQYLLDTGALIQVEFLIHVSHGTEGVEDGKVGVCRLVAKEVSSRVVLETVGNEV
jgi:hypothetical protein